MRHRTGSMRAPRQAGVPIRADRAADGAQRHRPRSHHGLSPEQESVLELQRLAGNAAVARALGAGDPGHVRSVDAIELKREGMAPELGLQQIREHTANKMTLALTQRSILDEPPIMRPEPAEKTTSGYTARTRKVTSIPEPKIHEWWPKEGRHLLSKGSYLDVDHDWEKKLEEGEDEHRDDANLAWELTWKTVQDTINKFADRPGPAEPTPEAAQNALWKRYVAALPKDLQPAGSVPSDSRQREILQVRPGTFMAWMWEITVARDTRMYHETTTGAPPSDSRPAPKGTMVSGIKAHPEFNVKGPTSEAFIEEIRKKYTPGRIIQGSRLRSGDATGDASK
jgi:hypothetical protein